MAVILNFGRECSCTVLQQNKDKSWKVVSFSDTTNDQRFEEIICRRLEDVYLHNRQRFADALMRYFSGRKYQNEKFYVTVSGLDTQYRTEIYNEQDFVGIEFVKMSEEDILNVVKAKMPEGAKELHEDYQPCVMHCAQYSEVIMAAAFLPQEYLQVIKDAFSLAGFDLFGIYPLAYGVYNALDFADGYPKMVYLQDATMIFSNLGMVVWDKPQEMPFEQRELDRYLYEDFAKIYSLDATSMNYSVLSLANAVAALRVKTEKFTPKFRIIGAFGVLLGAKDLGENKDGEGLDSVTGSIRKLFSKEGN